MGAETTTPNIGLQVPAYDQGNWQVPTNYNWNLLDLIFGGAVTVPALTVTTLTAGNAGNFVLPPAAAETPSGAVPGTAYVLTYTPSPPQMVQFTVNGLLQRYGVDFTITNNIVTLAASTSAGDLVYATYFYAA